MKKYIFFSLIGAVILFAWQFLSFAMPNFHKASSQFTVHQDEILQKFDELGLDEGMYVLGQPDPGLSQDQQSEIMDSYADKPWAVINYQKNMDMDMAIPMIRGLLVCFVIAWLLFWMFNQQKDPKLISRIYLSIAVGLIGFFFVPYSNFIWYKEPDIFAYFFDGIVPWAILGFIGHKMAPQ
ncbi:MAG: hypothetical protein K9H64_20095 [Bacteroidales bacterium]|nr:hypothetical protein [Bacteroidales bacterium]